MERESRRRRGRSARGVIRPAVSAASASLSAAARAALEEETALRRPFLWLPVAAGAGVILYFGADREPSFALSAASFAAFAALAFVFRAHRAGAFFLVLACLIGGFFAAVWRAARVDTPIVPRAGVGFLTGFVEEVDLRRAMARASSCASPAPKDCPMTSRRFACG